MAVFVPRTIGLMVPLVLATIKVATSMSLLVVAMMLAVFIINCLLVVKLIVVLCISLRSTAHERHSSQRWSHNGS